MNKAGNHGCGTFQRLFASLICTGLSSYGYIAYGLGFYELFPQFKCMVGDEWVESCSVE